MNRHVKALQEKPRRSKLLCEIGKAFLQDTRQRMNKKLFQTAFLKKKHGRGCFHVIISIYMLSLILLQLVTDIRHSKQPLVAVFFNIFCQSNLAA